MSIEHSQIVKCFLQPFYHILFPEGPVRKILVVRSGPEGPQFPRSVGTLHGRIYDISLIKNFIRTHYLERQK